MIAETHMLQALQVGIASIRSDPSQLANILFALNGQELAAAEQWFANPDNVIMIAPGFPMETTPLPFIGVTIADESQIEAQTPIGLNYYEYTDSQGNSKEVRGARFNGSLKATIYSPDANLVVWLSTVCKWAILSQYDWFGEQGFNNMSTSVGDFEPSPQFLPIFTFNRGLFFRAEYDFIIWTSPSPSSIVTTVGPITSGYTEYQK